MKSLAERHLDRAQRKVDNQAESGLGEIGGGVGAAAIAIATTQEILSGLDENQMEELKRVVGTDGFENVEKTDTYLKDMAGIGVVNPFAVPGGKYQELGKKGVQKSGDLPNPSFDPADGNQNGVAIEKANEAEGASNGWGKTAAKTDTKD